MATTTNAPVHDRPATFVPPPWLGEAAAPGDVPELCNRIGGEWRSCGDTFPVTSPIDGSRLATAQRARPEDVEAAVAAAAEARAGFQSMAAAERIAILERAGRLLGERRDVLADVITADLGKPLEDAHSEVDAACQRLSMVREEVRKIAGEYLPGDWIPDTAGKRAIVLREPVGTVATIGPFNYPLFLSASKIIPALAAGNTVVAKAPSDDPIALTLFVRVLEEAGLPPGALNLVTGSGSQIGDLLAGHDDVAMVSFTGSSAVGRHIASITGPKQLHLELGGNAAAIVAADADLGLAAAKTVAGAFKSAGQRCDAISRVFVERAVVDEYLERVVAEARQWTLGDPRAPGVRVGPLVKASAADSVAGLVDDATGKGAKLLLGGEHDGPYVSPTVLADVPSDAAILEEEQFGPVLPVVAVESVEEGLDLANRSRYGLDSAVFTADLDRAWRAASALQVGMVTVNDAPKHGVGHFPFGGRTPDSGIGREGLGYSIDECTALKTVVLPSP